MSKAESADKTIKADAACGERYIPIPVDGLRLWRACGRLSGSMEFLRVERQPREPARIIATDAYVLAAMEYDETCNQIVRLPEYFDPIYVHYSTVAKADRLVSQHLRDVQRAAEEVRADIHTWLMRRDDGEPTALRVATPWDAGRRGMDERLNVVIDGIKFFVGKHRFPNWRKVMESFPPAKSTPAFAVRGDLLQTVGRLISGAAYRVTVNRRANTDGSMEGGPIELVVAPEHPAACGWLRMVILAMPLA